MILKSKSQIKFTKISVRFGSKKVDLYFIPQNEFPSPEIEN